MRGQARCVSKKKKKKFGPPIHSLNVRKILLHHLGRTERGQGAMEERSLQRLRRCELHSKTITSPDSTGSCCADAARDNSCVKSGPQTSSRHSTLHANTPTTSFRATTDISGARHAFSDVPGLAVPAGMLPACEANGERCTWGALRSETQRCGALFGIVGEPVEPPRHYCQSVFPRCN